MDQNKNMKALMIIANAGFSEEIIEITREEGARGATIMNARGESALREKVMNITVDSEREIILCLVDEEAAESIMHAIKAKAGHGTPPNSICFAMPVDNVIGI